jgi:hypothetical protein
VKNSGQVSVQPPEAKDEIIITQSSANQDRQDGFTENKNATNLSKPDDKNAIS